MEKTETILKKLPGLDCGLCGSKNCTEFAAIVADKAEEIKRCVHLSDSRVVSKVEGTCSGCSAAGKNQVKGWKDSLGREFDFILDTFADEPGPRETILPHNPLITREMDIKKGDILIGRPLGMSCGCPITHCGIAMNVDPRTGVIVWCVTGPLGPRAQSHKDIGYYSAQAYEGLIKDTNKEIKIGMRYWFLPHRCMLQWRHSGLVNFVNNTPVGMQVRIEGLYIG